MNKTKLRNEIFNAIMTNGVMSSKDDIISNDPDDRVYTKRVNIGKDYCSKNFSFIEVQFFAKIRIISQFLCTFAGKIAKQR